MSWISSRRCRSCIITVTLIGLLLLVLPSLAHAYITQESPAHHRGKVFPSHSYANLAPYNNPAVVVRPTFYHPQECQFYINPPVLNNTQLGTSHLGGYILLISSQEISDHQCGGIAEFLANFKLTDGFNPSLFLETQTRPIITFLFTSPHLRKFKYRDPVNLVEKAGPDCLNYLTVTDEETGRYIVEVTDRTGPMLLRFNHPEVHGPFTEEHNRYVLALDNRTLFVMIFFSLVYAWCQIINLFYQEGWVIDTRIILYVSSVTWFLGSLLRLSSNEPLVSLDLVYHVMKLIAFSGYGFVQLKWGQILAKLFKRRIYKLSIIWGIFAICNNIIMLVLLIIRQIHPYIDRNRVIVRLYSFYIPILYLGQSISFLYFGLQFYRGMKTLCMSARTKSSFRKLSLLCFLAGVGYMIQAVALPLQGVHFSSTVPGHMVMVTLAILSGLICFTPVFVILSIRGTDENATYAAVLNSTRVHDPSDTTGPTSKSSSATTVEEIKLEHNGSQQPLKTDIQLDPAGSDTSILIPASPSTASSISQEPSPVKPLPSVKPKYQPAFTPLSPPPRPYMKREYSDTLEEVPNVPLALDHESIVMERCQEVRAGEHSNCVVDWRPSFGHSDESDGSEVDQSSTN